VRVPALRPLLRHLHATGHIPLRLGAVPAGRAWRPGPTARAPADHLYAVLASYDCDSTGGRRDHAIVLATARPALCGGKSPGCTWSLPRQCRWRINRPEESADPLYQARPLDAHMALELDS
jgi:hypothetical protein